MNDRDAKRNITAELIELFEEKELEVPDLWACEFADRIWEAVKTDKHPIELESTEWNPTQAKQEL